MAEAEINDCAAAAAAAAAATAYARKIKIGIRGLPAVRRTDGRGGIIHRPQRTLLGAPIKDVRIGDGGHGKAYKVKGGCVHFIA